MQPMQPTTNKETIEAELKAQKEKRPYFVTKLQGVIARDRFPPRFRRRDLVSTLSRGLYLQGAEKVMKKAKWTYRQLTNAMSNEGWENWHQGTWAFKRQDGTFYQVNLYRYDAKDRRVEWHKWAEANETPPPF